MVHLLVIACMYIGIPDGEQLRRFENDVGHVIHRIHGLSILITRAPHGEGLVGTATGK